jgi:hypothetical protein
MRVDEEALELAAQAAYECNAGTMTWAEIKGRSREADCRHEAKEAITAHPRSKWWGEETAVSTVLYDRTAKQMREPQP